MDGQAGQGQPDASRRSFLFLFPFLNHSTLGQRAVLIGQTMHPTSLLSSHSLLALEALAIPPLCCARRAFFIVCEPFI